MRKGMSLYRPVYGGSLWKPRQILEHRSNLFGTERRHSWRCHKRKSFKVMDNQVMNTCLVRYSIPDSVELTITRGENFDVIYLT